ncbi:hypothetical protein TELCIR_03407 [Teladorsagia circumcincta]|uniref:Alpha-carbonic anhydrase domain-containing protein n=1 Tax=Teladorsagia circumcincta TaxID=45464 RepID=A0A2G9UWN0_TELCI|nr:hypothetical protein TELCIR_03407 [Teladorsagia circumcincta]
MKKSRLVLPLSHIGFPKALNPIGHWSYTDVNHWGGTCSTGRKQSPINLDSSLNKLLSVLLYKQNERFLAEMEGFKEWDNRPYVTGDNIPGKYYLDHLHFHWGETDDFGSEDSIDGKRYSMECKSEEKRNELLGSYLKENKGKNLSLECSEEDQRKKT